MASSSLLLPLAPDDLLLLQTLTLASSTASSASSYASTAGDADADDAFVPVFRSDPFTSRSLLDFLPSDHRRSQFLSVDSGLFSDALVAPGSDHLGFGDDDPEEVSTRWDCLQLDETETDPGGGDEFEWEEVAAVASGEPTDPEWEVLADVPAAAASARHEEVDEGFVYTSDHESYDVVVGGEGFLKSLPPAARSAIEALPSLVLSGGDAGAGEGEECAVCKDGVAAGERVKRLPCAHQYHEECIVPWLGMRNSCPLCRFELPTDDPEYESWKAAHAAF